MCIFETMEKIRKDILEKMEEEKLIIMLEDLQKTNIKKTKKMFSEYRNILSKKEIIENILYISEVNIKIENSIKIAKERKEGK